MGLSANTSSSLDLYEVAVLVGSAFLVNYITSDAKTNWVCPTNFAHTNLSPSNRYLVLRLRV